MERTRKEIMEKSRVERERTEQRKNITNKSIQLSLV